MPDKSLSKSTSSGAGRATAAGIEYQSRAAAYFCVKILAEKNLPSGWNLANDETLEIIESETKNQVDDLLIRSSVGRQIFINVKHKLINSTNKNSDLGKAIDQLVRQFLQNAGSNLQDSKLVLITSSKSSDSIKTHLSNLLLRARKSSGQALYDIVRNDEERKVLTTVRNHVNIFWAEEANAAPTNEQIKQFLESVWLEILDVDAGGKDEQIAQTWINSLILDDNNGTAAWNHLIGFCLSLISLGGSTNRRDLQAELLRLGLRPQNTKSFQEDIEKLKTSTKRVFQTLQDLSVIKVGQKEIKIERPVKDALLSVSDLEPVVVTGEPGSGKSGVLYNFVGELLGRERDVVFLAVDKIESGSKTAFYQELRLEHDFHEILENWIGDELAYLVVDALDASRDPAKAKFINNLIEDVLQNNKRWRVIASIRKFDLRYNRKLQSLFAGRSTDEYSLPEFPNLRHINIPKLTAEEWLQIPQQHLDFGTLFLQASDELRELLFIPFNLRLLGELFGEGVSVGELSPIRTQIELLERYWRERVIGSDFGGDTRESVLTKAVDLMVKSRQMQLNRQELMDTATGNTLNEILSQNVMSEWQGADAKPERSVLTFSHHVIFDYAVARLFLRGTEDTFVGKLESDNELVLAIRPSIILHFQYELMKSHPVFWQQVFRIVKSDKIPAIGKLIGTSVAVGSAEDVGFFTQFFDLLTSGNAEKKQIGEKTLTHIARELKVKSSESVAQLFSNNKQLWADFLERLSENLNYLIAHNIRYLMWNYTNHFGDFTDEQITKLGTVSRRLLDFAVVSPNHDSLLASSAITFVCRTFASDKDESAKILRRVLESAYVRQYGHDELNVFANEIENLSALDPALVEEIYRAAFTNSDYNEDVTSMSHSRILNLTSTRRQDFGMMQFSLKNEYGKFLRQSPVNAVRALIDAVNAFVEEEYLERLGRRRLWTLIGDLDEKEARTSETFILNDQEVRLQTDYSEMWDSGTNYRNSHHLEILGIFTNYFEEICSDENTNELRDEILDLITKENQNAIFWRRIIACGAKFPDSMGRKLHSLAWTMPILFNQDTSRIIGNYIQTNFSNFTLKERELTEKAILSIPDLGKNDDEKRHLHYDRNRLIGCLNENYIITDEAREILRELRDAQKIPSNERRYDSDSFTSEEYTDEMFLRESGVQLEKEENQLIKKLYEPVENFAGKFKNDASDLGAVKDILPSLQALYKTLNFQPNEGTQQPILDYAWGHLADACAAAVEAEELANETEAIEFLKEALLVAADYPVPEATEKTEENFNDFPSWGFPFVRGDAGQGLVRLARFETGASEEVLTKIQELVFNDPVPAVRYHIAIRMNSLSQTEPELMWRILDKICVEDKNRSILDWLTKGCLRTLAYHYPDKCLELAKKVYERFRQTAEVSEIRKNCTFIFLLTNFRFKNAESREILEQFVNQPNDFIDEVSQIIMSCGESLNVGIGESANKENDYIRSECFRLLERICRNAYAFYQIFKAELDNKDFSQWTEEEKNKLKHLHRIIDFIITKVYFASGGAERIQTDVIDGDKIPMGSDERLQFWRESQGLLNAVAETSFSDVTHRLVETLEFLFSYDPKGVFLLLGKAIHNGRADGYQYESIAVSNIIKIIEAVLSQYAYLLKENQECRQTMIEILDTFVEAGWEAAHKLTYRLEEIYR